MLFVKDYISGTKLVLRLLGAEAGERGLAGEARGWVTTAFSTLAFFLHVTFILRGSMTVDISDMVMAYCTALFSAAAALKILLLQLTWRHHYPELFDFIDGWYMLDTPVCRQFKVLYEGSLYSAFLLVLWFCSVPVLSWERVLPISIYSPPWDLQASLFGYGLCYLLQIVTILLLMASLVVADYAVLMCCIGFRSHLDHIISNFEKLSSESDMPLLRSNIKHHQLILRKLKVLKIPCAPLFFMQVFTSFTGACLLLFSAIKQGVESAEVFMRLFVCVMSVYSQLLLYCWVGQNITNASDSLQFSIYNNKWYKCSPKSRKMFHMVETFACKNLEIQGSYVFKMKLHTFHQVLTESYSYLMILIQMTNKDTDREEPAIS